MAEPFSFRGRSASRLSFLAVAGLVGVLVAQPARAQAVAEEAGATEPSRAQCLDAHQNAQRLTRANKLLEARKELTVCGAASCPGAVIVDCVNWVGEIDRQTPSMVFEVTLDGKQVQDAKVFVDDQAVVDPSQAFKVNPGRHTVRAELRSFSPQVEELALAEGVRARLVSIAFRTPEAPTQGQAAPAPQPPSMPLPQATPRRPMPVVVYPLLGVGIAGLAGFGVFSLVGKSRQGDLERDCSPSCTSEDLKPMKTAYLLGDVSLGVGAAALVTAGIVYLARPTAEAGSARRPLIAFSPLGTSDKPSLGVIVSDSW